MKQRLERLIRRFTAWVIQRRINLRRREIKRYQKDRDASPVHSVNCFMNTVILLQLNKEIKELEARRAEVLSIITGGGA